MQIMHNEQDLKEITERLEAMSYEEVMDTLMDIELLVAERQNKIVFSEHDNVQ
jgi:hypothetical protein